MEKIVEINTEYNSFDRELQIDFSGRLVDGTAFESSAGIEV